MKRISALAAMIGALVIVLSACSSESEPTAVPTVVPTASAVASTEDSMPVIPDDSEVDRRTAMLLGIDLHRQLWSSRPSDNYKFGFQWNVGEYAYQRANVEVRIIKGEIDEVLWADNAVKTDGSEPVGFVVPEQPDKADFYSIDGLFRVISDAVDSDPARVSLGFDSVFGFPTSAIIEFAPERGLNDVSFFAAQLVPLPGPPE